MGRVKRYKKIKSCDPFYRGSRKIDKGADLPPKKDDQSSNSFRYFLEAKKTVPKSEISTAEKNSEIKLSRKRKKRTHKQSLKDSADNEEEMEEDEPVFKKKRGESDSQFLARVEVESGQRLLEAGRKVRKSSDKRKNYNKQRKIKHQLRRLGVNLEDAEGMDFKDLKDHISFNEVVKKPPNLSRKPRGLVTQNAQMNSDLLLSKLDLKKSSETEAERQRVVSFYRRNKTRTRQ